MDFNFLASANSITNTYLNQNAVNKLSADSLGLSEEAKKSFDEEISKAYDSLASVKALSENMHQSYDNMHSDKLQEHASRLGYSIDNRIIDMLHVQLSDDMNAKVNTAMNNALESLV